MLKQSITYEDFNGDQRTEDFFFNLTSKELLELDRSVDGGFESSLNKAISNQDVYSIYDLIQKTILKAYGQKSEDGRFFKKTPELTEEFEVSAAYQSMLQNFIDNPDLANNFITGILPKDLREKAAKANAENKSI